MGGGGGRLRILGIRPSMKIWLPIIYTLYGWTHKPSLLKKEKEKEAIVLQFPFKGIVSRDFVPFFISLDRFEGRNRAGADLFFILMTFSCLN
jgi:hypothetical protein